MIYLVPVYLLLFAASCLHLLHYYPLLPDDLWGQSGPEAMTKQSLAAMYLGFLLFNFPLFLATCFFISKYPHRLNIPNRQYWLAAERAKASIRSAQMALTCLAALLGIFVAHVIHSVFYMHLRKVTEADATEMRVFGIVSFALFICIFAWPFYRFRKPPRAP